MRDVSRLGMTLRATILSAVASASVLSSVNIAIPDLIAVFDVTAATATWVPLSYLLTSAAILVPAAHLSQVIGPGRLFLYGTAVASVAACVVCFAQSWPQIIFGRALQGIAAGCMFAVIPALITSLVAAKERGEKLGVQLSATYFGLAAGPFIGGVLMDLMSWRAVFLFPAPLFFAAFFIGLRVFDDTDAATLRWRDYDRIGAVLYVLSIVLIVIGTSNLPTPSAVLATAVGVFFLVLFVGHAKRRDNPVFDISLFLTNRLFTRSCGAAVMMYAAFFSTSFLISLYLQDIAGIEPFWTGLILVTQPCLMFLLTRWAGAWSDRVEPKWPASLGLFMNAVGILLLASADASTGLSRIVLGLALSGLGMALFSSPNQNAMMGAVDRSQLSTASSSIGVMRLVGQIISMASVAIAFTLAARWNLAGEAISSTAEESLLRGLRAALFIAAGCCAVGIILSWARGALRTPEKSA